MTTPVDKIINELTELATGLYDFLLRTEGRPERAGWLQQLEGCRKRVLVVRLLAGQSDYRGLHDACLIQQEYLSALLADPYSPTSLDWEHLERWPLLILPCVATPLSHAAVDELVHYCRNVGVPAARNADGPELRNNLLKITASSAPASARVVPLPFTAHRSTIVEAPASTPARAPVNEETSVRYLLQRELLDALSEYLSSADSETTQHDALRLCADRIQLLGISAAGAGWVGLMDCCLLCHDALHRRMARDGALTDEESNAFKTWTGLISRYLETPQDLAGIDALIGFYQRGHFIAKITDRDYDNLLEALIRDGVAEPSPVVGIEIVKRSAPAPAFTNESNETLVDPLADPLREIEQQLAATIERNARLQQLASAMDQRLTDEEELQHDELTGFVQSLMDISNEYDLAAQSTQMHLNTLGELIAAATNSPQANVATQASINASPTTSLVHALLVRSGDQVLAVSIRGIDRVFHAGSGETVIDGHRLHYHVNEMRYDACELETLLQLPVDRAWLNDSDRSAILVYDDVQQPRVMFVESVLAAQELEVKPIGPYMPRFPGVIGVTLLASGELAPVIDLPGLLRMAAHPETAMFAMETAAEPEETS